MANKKIKTLHVARRFVSNDLRELNTGFDLEHFVETAKLTKKNTVIFQSKDKKHHKIVKDNLIFFLVPSLFDVFFCTLKQSKNHDVIIAQNPFITGLIAVIIGFFTKKPVIVGVFGEKFSVKKIQQLMKGFVCSRATIIRANSNAVKNSIISWGTDPGKIVVIEDRVNCDHFNPNVNGDEIRKKLKITGKMIISIGSLIEIKGFDTLIDAAKIVLEFDKKIKFIIIGEGPLKEKLVKKTKDLGIEKNIEFIGKIPTKDMPLYYAASDLVVHPSYTEAMGRVILEAQSCGKALIANKVGGIPEAVMEKSALLIEPKNSILLSKTIIKLLRDDELRKSMGESGRRFVQERFEFFNQEKKLMTFYEKIVLNSI